MKHEIAAAGNKLRAQGACASAPVKQLGNNVRLMERSGVRVCALNFTAATVVHQLHNAMSSLAACAHSFGIIAIWHIVCISSYIVLGFVGTRCVHVDPDSSPVRSMNAKYRHNMCAHAGTLDARAGNVGGVGKY